MSKSRPTNRSNRTLSWASTRLMPLPSAAMFTRPRHRNIVPMVATRDGIPTTVTRTPLSSPAASPIARQTTNAASTLPVATKTDEKAQLEKPSTDGNERSIRSEEHTYELQSLMRISYAVFCLKKKKQTQTQK